MEKDQFRRLEEEIIYCSDRAELERIVQRIVQPTGFGAPSMAEDGVEVCLDYREISDCLVETDRNFFHYEIELLMQAQQQIDIIQAGQVPEKPETIPPWQMFT